MRPEDVTLGFLRGVVQQQMRAARRKKAAFRKVVFRRAEALLAEHRTECLLNSRSLRTCDDVLVYESLKLETRREFVHSLFFLGMPTGRPQNASTSSNLDKDSYSRRGTKKLFKTQSSFFFNFGNLRQAQLSLKLLEFLSLDDLLFWRHRRARDWRRHRDFLSCHRLPFRLLKQYFDELREDAPEASERKAKRADRRERPVFARIADWHRAFDEALEGFRRDLRVDVVCAPRESRGEDLPGPSRAPKAKKGPKREEDAPPPRWAPDLSNLSWNFLGRTPSEEIDARSGLVQGPSAAEAKARAPPFSAFVKSDFWTRLHCLHDFDPVMRALKELEVVSQNLLSQNQSSHFKLSGSNGFSVDKGGPDKGALRLDNPWGATFSGLPDFSHPPNEFVFWLSSCLQGLLDSQIDSGAGERPCFLANIFPQKNGRPVTSRTGEYWVRLHFLGQPVKVRVDDWLPVDCLSGELLVPLSEAGEIWPALYAKAICKLFGIGDFYRAAQSRAPPAQKAPAPREALANRKVSQASHNLMLHSSFLANHDLLDSALLRGSDLPGQKENAPQLTPRRLRKMRRALQSTARRSVDLDFEDLIANVDVVHAVTGFVPLRLTSKHWDNVFFAKFCEAISQDNAFAGKVKVFGLKQAKVP